MAERVKNASEAAVCLGVSKPTLYEWKARGCPWKENGEFPIDRMKAWHEGTVRPTKPTMGQREDRDESEPPGDLGWNARKLRADALTAETKYKKEAGKLVNADEVTQQFMQVVIEIMTQMKQLPDRVAGLTDNPEVKRSMKDRISIWVDDICETSSRSVTKTIAEIMGKAID